MIKRRFFLGVLSLLLLAGCEPSIEVFPDQFQGYDIPDYFQKQILEKEEQIKELLTDSSNTSSFIFLTDVHWEINSKHSPEIIRHIQNKTGIKNVFFGGDAINGSSDKDEAMATAVNFAEAFNYFDHFYSVFGNHDSNKITANLSNSELWFTNDEVYSFLHGRLQDDSSVYYGNYWYYYVDDPESLTRYLCIDSGKNKITTDERAFIANVLTTTPDGWHIVIVTHIVYNASDLYDPSTVFVPKMMEPVVKIAELNNARGEYSDEQLNYNFSNSMGRVDCIVGGHIHRDYIGQTQGGIPMMALDCDCRHTYSKEGNRIGTINEHCITVVITDHNSDEIHLVRFGRGKDRTIH